MASARVAPQTGTAPRRLRCRVLLLALFAALLLALAAPSLLWAYHLSAAGALLEHGLAWPTPRQVDALPAVANANALSQAQRHLEQARRWRPDHAHAYRLSAYAAMAAGDWAAAARLLEAARMRAPGQPLIAWETGLVYEQLWLANPQDATLRTRMIAAWREGGFDAAILQARAEEARRNGRLVEAQRWNRRATVMVQYSNPA